MRKSEKETERDTKRNKIQRHTHTASQTDRLSENGHNSEIYKGDRLMCGSF